jgi:hypothetical protein
LDRYSATLPTYEKKLEPELWHTQYFHTCSHMMVCLRYHYEAFPHEASLPSTKCHIGNLIQPVWSMHLSLLDTLKG